MLKIVHATLLLFTLSLMSNLNGCYKQASFTTKQITQRPPQNRIADVIKQSNLSPRQLELTFFSYQQVLHVSRVETCKIRHTVSLNPEQYENIKKNMNEKKDLYLYTQEKNREHTHWFKIEHKGLASR